MPNNLILFLILFSCSWALAREQESIHNLSLHPHWLKLLHYSDHLIRTTGSDIKNNDFFLAHDGSVNPEAELAATVEGLKKNGNISCKFPARRLWLEKMGFNFPIQKCPKFEEWTRQHSVKSVSLIFASGFLGNPASYFGHPLLKFNFKDERSPLDLLDTAINYGAFTPPDVGALPYALRGLFGGYDAGFTSADFFFHKNNYSELELRDLWEYELNLTSDQVYEFAAHVWEMQQAKITYYFFNDNCAFRVGDILEVILDKEFVNRKLPFSIPSHLFHKIHDYGLVKDIKLIKSRQSRLHDKVSTLNKREKKHLKYLSNNIDHLKTSEFKALDQAEKLRILETASDYYSYRLVSDNELEVKEAKRRVLSERISLPPSDLKWNSITKEPPHRAQKPILTQPGYFYSEEFGETASLRVRPAFYDLISPDAGRPPLSNLSVLDIELNANEEKLWIKSFNFISIETLNLSKTGLKGEGGDAWRFSAGADQQTLACNDCLVPKLEFGGGKAWEISKYLVLYAMLDPRIQSNHLEFGYVSIKPNLSALVTVSDEFRIHAVVGRRYYLNADHSVEDLYLVEGRIGSSRDWDLRVSFQEHIDRRYGLGISVYW